MTVRNLAIEVAGQTVVLCIDKELCLEVHLTGGQTYKYPLRSSSPAAIGTCLIAHIIKYDPSILMDIPNHYGYEIEKFVKYVNFLVKNA